MSKSEAPRIGVYVCHCGLNIAGVLDCAKLAEFASKLPNVVVARDYRYMCSDPGQELIKKDIKEYKLNRVVVAACSPRMHEPTFRRCVADAGLNPYFFEMANIREHCSWCHAKWPDEAFEKAKDTIAAAVAKASHLQPLKPLKVPVTKRVLIIGGGVAGITAALDLSDMGYEVILVEKSPSIGGRMAQLDKTFPTLDCSICILGPLMVDVARRPNVKLYTYSEVINVDGYVGNFKVRILKKPRYVDVDACNACGECAKVCPVEVPNEFDEGLAWRKAIYIPFPQAVPAAYVLDDKNCLGLTPLVCGRCKKACEEAGRNAINYSDRPEIINIEVGAIIVATGYDLMDVSQIKEYGYGLYPNVITALELERLINAAGPTEGHVIRPSDGRTPKKVAFIQCVGSRDLKWREYCSGFCCMYALKNSILLKEHYPDIDITIFYIDMRTAGKGFEEFYRRAREEGIKFVRGKPAEIIEDPATRNLIIIGEDQNIGRPIKEEFDMVVLSPAAVPRTDTDKLCQILNITTDRSGFFLESHPKLKPIDTPTDGIFICGAAHGPKDIPYSVAQASGAAAKAARILSKDHIEIEPIVSYVIPTECIRAKNPKAQCGLCAKVCPFKAIELKPGKPAEIISAKCHGCGTCVAECPHDAIIQFHFTDYQIASQIMAHLREKPEEKILAFTCNWCSYAGADLAGTSRYEYPPDARVIRVMCSGRIDPTFVYLAFRLGAGMVLVSGCRLTEYGSDCHYISGNRQAKVRFERYKEALVKAGLTPSRLRLEWVSAAEGDKWAAIMTDMSKELRSLGTEFIRKENEKLKPYLERMLRRAKQIQPLVAMIRR